MERRIRDHDWSKTPLGPAEGWPASLKTAVRIMLDSRYPMFVWWGDTLINIYNDSYAPVLGDRHPEALGRPAREIWSEIWDTVGPQSELVMRERRSTWNEELQLVMERNGFPEESFFTYSYSPIPGDDGGVGGLFCACTEETQRVLGRRRLRLLGALAERAAEAKSIEGACEIAASTLAENPNDIPFALLYLLEPDGTRARLAGSFGLVPSHPASPPTVELGGDGDPWEFARVAHGGEAVLVDDLAARFGRLPRGVWPESPSHAIVLPMVKGSESPRPAGFVVAGISPRLPFHDDYRGFMGLVAGQIGTAVANARAYEEERRRAEALARLDEAKTLFFSNVSHEFRTPLTLMLGPVEDILDRPAVEVTPEIRRLLEIVRRNGSRLLRLVNTLLDFARIEAGRARATLPADAAGHADDGPREPVSFGRRTRRAPADRRLPGAPGARLRRSRNVGEDRPEPPFERLQVHAGRRDRPRAAVLPGNGRALGPRHGHRDPGRGDAPPLRAVPSRPGRERPDPRRQRHRPGSRPGAREAARRRGPGRKPGRARDHVPRGAASGLRSSSAGSDRGRGGRRHCLSSAQRPRLHRGGAAVAPR